MIDASTAVQDYRVFSAGELISNGASTLQISTTTGAKLSLNNTTTTTAGSSAAISLTGAEADISASRITGANQGMSLGFESSMRIGAIANVSNNSTITGGNMGVSVGSLGTLNLQDSTVIGTNSGSRGLVIWDSTAAATGSTITGQQNGILMRGLVGGQDGRLTLDSTRVEGVEGAAIVVGLDPRVAPVVDIAVNNGSTLIGGNGNILEVMANATANVGVNASSLTGNVQVDGTGTANMRLAQSTLTGDVIAEQGGIANVELSDNSVLTGRLENTTSVAINSGAQWVMVGDGAVADLSMNGGAVKFGDAASFYTLSVENLSGTGGTFIMDVDFANAQTDFLNVTGNATGNHSLLIGSTGADVADDSRLHVVHTAAGDASFALMGGAVDLGAWSYDLTKQGANDWYLDATTRKISPGAQAVMALFNTAPTVWYGELSSLRSRMGELRLNGERSGGWMRTYGNKFNVADASGFGYKQVQQGFSLGADGKLPMGDGQWLAGVMAGQSKSDLDLDRGTNGKVDSYYVGAYSTWLDSETGYYFDGVLKFNRFNNKAKVNLSDGTRTKGDYDNSGVGASLEFGRHIKLDNNYFVEPYTQLSGVIVEGKDYDLDNGMRAEGDQARSLLGKVGATVGRNFDLGQGRTVQPYIRAAVAHEFAKDNAVKVNDNRFNNDLSGSRGELGTGIAVALSDNLQLHADFDYSNGDRIEQPWGANVGVRYNW